MSNITDTDVTETVTERVASLERQLGDWGERTRVFEQVAVLLALITDPRACEAKFSELRRLMREAARVRLELTAEASQRADDRRAFEAERAALAEREQELRKGEAQVEAKLEVLAKPPSPYAGLEQLPGGLTREPDDELPSRRSDPHFSRRSAVASDDEIVTEPAGNDSTTLVRSTPQPRRSMRKAQPNA